MSLELQGYGMLAGLVLSVALLMWPIFGLRKSVTAVLVAMPITCGLLWLIAVHLGSGYGQP